MLLANPSQKQAFYKVGYMSMNDLWHFLREFESTELVKQCIKDKYGYSISTAKSKEIASAFTQGREFFKTALEADLSVKPILLYYGILALSRGLILIMDKGARENSIASSHGIKLTNWNDVIKSYNFEDLVFSMSKGTFRELIEVTDNVTYLRANCSGVNWKVGFDMPDISATFSLKDISNCYPDISHTIKSWTGIEIPCAQMSSFVPKDSEYEIQLEHVNDESIVSLLFPKEFFQDISIDHNENSYLIKIPNSFGPNFTQKWVSAFGRIGDAYIIPPFVQGIKLNLISVMFSTSYALSMISRYHPSVWQNIIRGIEHDRILPFILNILDLLQGKYPQVILDYLQSPYKFETEKQNQS
jgi:hypothetical protein